MKWSNEQIVQFLELYEGEPSIWNPSDPNHKLRNHVHDAWGRISKNLSAGEYPISELKKKKIHLWGHSENYRRRSRLAKRLVQVQMGYSNPNGLLMNIWQGFCMGFFNRVKQNIQR